MSIFRLTSPTSAMERQYLAYAAKSRRRALEYLRFAITANDQHSGQDHRTFSKQSWETAFFWLGMAKKERQNWAAHVAQSPERKAA